MTQDSVNTSGVGNTPDIGRPSEYTQDVADAICECLALGMSLRKICEQEGMPSKSTVFNWLGIHPLFLDQYRRARELQAETHVDDIVRIADEATDAGLAKVRIDARKWHASKIAPKKYGDRVALEHEGEIGLNVAKVSNRDRAKAMAALLAKARKGDHG